MGVDKHSGELVWGEPGELPFSPVFVGTGEQSSALVVGTGQVQMVDPATGRVIWSDPLGSRAPKHRTALDPLVVEGNLFVSRYGSGAICKFSNGRLEELWDVAEGASQSGTWVHVNGYLYGNNSKVGTVEDSRLR